MTGRYLHDQIENWVADFCQSDGARRFTGSMVEYATEILAAFLVAACDARGVGPDEIDETDVRSALLSRVAAMDLPPEVRDRAPELCAAFLEDLEARGRVGGGGSLATFVRALRSGFVSARGGGRVPERRVAPKLGPNEPCPCGSGKKFKRCCAR
jgi:SEC-C motif-containing protein